MTDMSIRPSLSRGIPEMLDAGLRPLLDHLRWRGSERDIAEATGTGPLKGLGAFRNVLARLGFSSQLRRARLAAVDARLLPCLFVSRSRVLVVLAADQHGRLRCFDCARQQEIVVRPSQEAGLLCAFELNPHRASMQGGGKPVSWLKLLLNRFQGTFLLLFGLTLTLNLLALVPVFFVQAVYDAIIPARNVATLWAFAGGVSIVICADAGLRIVRGALLAQFGARLDFLVGASLLDKLLSFPLGLLESTSAGTKLAQLREGEIVRHALSGQLALSLFELPFIAIFVAALAYLGGWLALIPVVTVMLAAGTGLLVIRYMRATARRQAVRAADHQALLMEMLTNITAIKASGTEALWRERFRERSAASAMQVATEMRTATLTETLAYLINVLSGAATLAGGATVALTGSLSVGTLIASMTIVWRLLAPVQATFVALSRLEQIRQSGIRLSHFMQASPEMQAMSGPDASNRARRFAGRIALDRVFFRHENHQEAAIAGVSLTVEAGEVVAIAGGNGSGKSTLLKLVAALIRPQMGSIQIDGIDLRHIPTDVVREQVTLLPQRACLFDGTLRTNLRLANLQASDDALWDSLARVGLVDEVRALPAGLETRVDGRFSENFVKRLALARTLLVEAPIVLLDDLNVLLDPHGDDIVLEQIAVLRGRATILLVTNNPAHVQAADRAIVLRSGTIIHDGTPQELMRRLSGQPK
ncbi:ATP-binding cassette domain-containing protein [Lichenihabitans sp. Uapishka_5]|uniref:peptidase domain-containing ABC transporter n=1 Tax=Lichenihabitans sp. Uapishka_5 TaxID=3037302 RepID=UPI0029E7D71B|nr:ATP-binding cassette domain-containing protein [Lichenihabitans sp. Uapishka_5]MDX7950864.1 ATP-binding cassette domain-containing protein [Lichenihabitans sp. Uapishka_5]